MDSDSVRGIDRRPLLGLAAAGAPLVGAQPGHADPTDREQGIPNSERVAFNLSSAGKPFGRR